MNLPFKYAETCFYTTFNEHTPMLVIQDQYFEFAVFHNIQGTWQRQFTIPGMKYKLMNAFGHFLVGMSL